MATYTKRHLSGSTDGAGIPVTATSGVGTTIHTAAASATTAPIDEIHLWATAYNTARTLTIQYAATVTNDNDITILIDADDGLAQILPGLTLSNAKVVRAYADATGVVCYGYVNRVSP